MSIPYNIQQLSFKRYHLNNNFIILNLTLKFIILYIDFGVYVIIIYKI